MIGDKQEYVGTWLSGGNVGRRVDEDGSHSDSGSGRQTTAIKLMRPCDLQQSNAIRDKEPEDYGKLYGIDDSHGTMWQIEQLYNARVADDIKHNRKYKRRTKLELTGEQTLKCPVKLRKT